MMFIFGHFLLVLLSIASLEAHRLHCYFPSFFLPAPRFDIFHPKGVAISYPRLWGMDRFEIKVYLNKGCAFGDPPCDICLNTTTTTPYGQFVTGDDNVLIQIGDILNYSVKLHMSDGCVHGKKDQFYVMKNPIFRLPTTCANDNGQSKVAKLEEEVVLLENIIQDVLQNHSNNSSEITKNLYLNFRPASVVLEPPQLYDNTLKVLQKKLPNVDWKTVLVGAFYYNDGVGFEVKTLLDKLKVLQMSKHFVQETVTDLDRLGDIEDEADNNHSEVIFHGLRSGV